MSELIRVEVKGEENRLGAGTWIYVGEHLWAVITPETPQWATDRFIKLMKEQDKTYLIDLVYRYNERIKWNHEHTGQAKDWPVFNERERFKQKLLDEAGVIDS